MGQFHSKVVGVTHTNPDGSERQAYIHSYCRPGMPLIFKREPRNPHDSNAIGVWIKARALGVFTSEVQIGYLKAELAEDLAPDTDRGRPLYGRIAKITGDEPLGVNILLSTTGQVSEREARRESGGRSFLGSIVRGVTMATFGCFGLIVLAVVGSILISNSGNDSAERSPATANEISSRVPTRTQPVRDVTQDLYTSMPLELAKSVLGNNPESRGKIGEQEFYRWLLPDGRIVDATFENGRLIEWEE